MAKHPPPIRSAVRRFWRIRCSDWLGGTFMSFYFPMLLLLSPVLLFVFGVLVVWLILRWRYAAGRNRPEEVKLKQQFRQWRNQRAEEEMVIMLKELGWPKVVLKMKAEEVAHQLCNRLADRLWNRPNVD